MTDATILVKIATAIMAKDRADYAPVDLSTAGQERDRSEADNRALREYTRLTNSSAPPPSASSVPLQLFNVR
jgi:hypothetical protein